MNKNLQIFVFIIFLSQAIAGADEGPVLKQDIFKQIHPMDEKKKSASINAKLKAFKENLKIRERLELKGGMSGTFRDIRGANNSEEQIYAPGFNTNFTIALTPVWEIGAASYVFFGKIKKLEFDVDQTTLLGNGSFRDTTFSPVIRYIHPAEFYPCWRWYLVAGPAWSQQTLKLEDFVDRYGVQRREHKLTYESVGGVAGVGFQENLPYKEMNPVYFEFLYSYFVARKVTLVDSSNFTKIQTIHYEDVKEPINGSIFIFNLGLTIF